MPAAIPDETISAAAELYQGGESLRAVAARFGVDKSSLSKRFKRLGVRVKTRAEQVRARHDGAPWRDEAFLRDMYLKRGLSSCEIASELGCDKSVVIDWLGRFGIELRSLSEAHIGKEPANKGEGKRNSDETVECACGCGERIRRYGRNSNERRFAKGHRPKGAAHPLYKPHSVNRKPRHGRSDYRLWRQEVLKACDYTCQRCGQVGGKLQSHHIKPMAKYPELAFDVNNGSALCRPCHVETHKEMREAA